MRRSGAIALIALLLVALVGTSVAARRPGPTFVGRAGIGEAGGSLPVRAKVRHPQRTATFSAVARVSFDGLEADPVSVDLERRGRSFVARARVAIPDDQAVGPVSVTIVIEYVVRDTTITAEVAATGFVVASDDEDDDDDGDDTPPEDGGGQQDN